MPLKFVARGLTDVGRAREVNEDAFKVRADHDLWILADGMGGHASGQVASDVAVKAIEHFLSDWSTQKGFEWPFEVMESRSFTENALANSVRVANVRVYNHAQVNDGCEGMGTTVVVMQYHPDVGMAIAHLGDSRVYRLRDGDLRQITEDHSLVNHLRRNFHLSLEEARARAGKNVIVKAVGLEDDVDPELTMDMPRPGDLYLMCSDGLSDLVDDWIIQQMLAGLADDPEEAGRALIRAANQAGGTDNITVILIQVLNG